MVENSISESSTNRRNFLKGAVATGVIGTAGCLGNDDTVTVDITSPGPETTAGQAAQALQRAVREESDTVQMNVEEVTGDPDSIQLVDQGESQGHTASNYIMVQASNGEGAFSESPPDTLAHQGLTISSLNLFWMAVDGSGIETTDDLADEDVGVFPLPPGTGIRQFVESVLEEAGLLSDVESSFVEAEFGDAAGAIEEGRIDAFAAYISNYTNLSGWLTEVDARADVHVIEHTDEYLEGVENHGATQVEEIDIVGWEQDLGAEMINTWPIPYQLFFAPDVPADGVREIARVSHEHVDTIREAQESYLDHSDLDVLTSGYMDDFPIHSGVAELLQDNDAWEDAWTESSE